MNIDLLHQFGQNYPEEFDGVLDCVSQAVTCAFNRRGTLLAVGCNDGRVVIWDFLTRGIAKVISAHVHPVASLSWSRDGRYLVTACTDNTVCVWQVLTSECIRRWRFPLPIMKVQFNPRNDKIILVCPMKSAALLVYLPPHPGAERGHILLPLDDDQDLNITASWDRRGEYIFAGNAKGRLNVLKLELNNIGATIISSFRVSNTAIKEIESSKEQFLVNTADRVIRVYHIAGALRAGVNGELEPAQKLQDLVNKTMWKKCCFSGGTEADYICAGSARQHSICIWERSGGSLVKMLHGTKGETLLDVVWHPTRPIIASISNGVVSIWAQAQVENWSAFAPDFKELDENVEYEERESEFDEEDEDRSPPHIDPEQDEEDLDVDVVGVTPNQNLLSSDEDENAEENTLIYLPVSLEIDESENVEVGDGTTNVASDPETPEKLKERTLEIELENASKDEIHPLAPSSNKARGASQASDKPKNPRGPRASGKRPNAGEGATTKRKKRVNYQDDAPFEL